MDTKIYGAAYTHLHVSKWVYGRHRWVYGRAVANGGICVLMDAKLIMKFHGVIVIHPFSRIGMGVWDR